MRAAERLMISMCLVLAICLVSIPASASDIQYVQVSLVKLRAEPTTSAKVRKLLPIGAEVRSTQHEDSIWCQIEPIDPSGPAGYTHCEFVGAERPTVEGLQAELKKAKKGTDEYRDLISRLFRLSPSVFTLRQGAGYANLSRGAKVDPIYPALMKTLAGPRAGADLRPVYRAWNKSDHDGRGLAAKPSYFTDPDQVFFVPGQDFLDRNYSRSGSPKGPDGKAEVRFEPTREEITHHLLEYSKLLPGHKAILKLDPPRESHDMHDPGMLDFLGFSAIHARFDPRPAAYFLTADGQWTTGSLVSVTEDIAEGMGPVNAAVVASPKPIEPIAIILSPRAPTQPAKMKTWKSGSWAADLDGDGVYDLALMRPEKKCEIQEPGDCCELALPLVNIAGKWKKTTYLEDCMGT